MKIVKHVDLGHVSNRIRCQMPECKRKPYLRHLYYLDIGIVVGSSCKNKCENANDFEKQTKSHFKRSKLKSTTSSQKSLLKLYDDEH